MRISCPSELSSNLPAALLHSSYQSISSCCIVISIIGIIISNQILRISCPSELSSNLSAALHSSHQSISSCCIVKFIIGDDLIISNQILRISCPSESPSSPHSSISHHYLDLWENQSNLLCNDDYDENDSDDLDGEDDNSWF